MMNEETRRVLARASEIIGLVPQLHKPLDEVTATALIMAAAMMVKAGSKEPATIERWLLTCASVFDSAPTAPIKSNAGDQVQ